MLEILYKISQSLAAIAVIATVGYLALQTRLQSRISEADLYHAVSQSWIGLFSKLHDDAEFASAERDVRERQHDQVRCHRHPVEPRTSRTPPAAATAISGRPVPIEGCRHGPRGAWAGRQARGRGVPRPTEDTSAAVLLHVRGHEVAKGSVTPYDLLETLASPPTP